MVGIEALKSIDNCVADLPANLLWGFVLWWKNFVPRVNSWFTFGFRDGDPAELPNIDPFVVIEFHKHGWNRSNSLSDRGSRK